VYSSFSLKKYTVPASVFFCQNFIRKRRKFRISSLQIVNAGTVPPIQDFNSNELLHVVEIFQKFFLVQEPNEYELDFDAEKSDSSQSEKKDVEKNEDKSKSSSDYSPIEPIKEASRRIPKNTRKPKSSSDETDSSRSAVENHDDKDRQKTIQQDSDRSLSVSDNKGNYKWLLKFYTTDKPKKTANKSDETVSFQIVGEKGETNPLKIISRDAHCFQSGQVDSFNIQTENIGKPKYIILSLISQASASKWYLNKVRVKLLLPPPNHTLSYVHIWRSFFANKRWNCMIRA
jgi:hypothetical protein